MPEGPEIRIAADRIAAVLVDQPVVDAALELPGLKRFEPRIVDSTVTAVDTRGKAMLTRFDNGLTLYSHNQLYGRWFTTKRPNLPRTGRQLRVALHTATHSALLYSASDIEVLTPSEIDKHPFLARLGPDILDGGLSADEIAARLSLPEFRRRSLGSLYLDQGFLAGNGNYLRSEILWCAGLDPAARPVDLDRDALERLAKQTLEIANRSYRTRGVTVPPKLARKLKARGLGYQKYRFHAFGRDGLPCYRCDTAIEKRTMGSRNLFVCPSCQDA